MISTLVFASLLSPGAIAPSELRCESLTDPLGIGTTLPRLSWKLLPYDKKSYNLSQSAYRIIVGNTPRASNLWDTGLVSSKETFDIKYAGAGLKPGQLCWWQVQVFDQDGNASDWSAPAKWSVGLLSPSDWKAQWIGYDAPAKIAKVPDTFAGASWIWAGEGTKTLVRKIANFSERITKAQVHISADDQFALVVNGKKVGNSDGNEDSWRRPKAFDLLKFVKSGENAIEITAENSQGASGIVASLQVEYEGGRMETLKTDGSWTGDSPVKVMAEYGSGPWAKVNQDNHHLPAPRLLRHEFALSKSVKRAMVYGSALGLLELRLNGKAVSDELFMPGWTDYTKRVYSRAYDVTQLLKTGTNAVGVELGDGWYTGYVGYGQHRDFYGTRTRALVQLEVEYSDGSTETIASSPEWLASTGPTLEADFLMGENYDATREMAGWDKPDFDSIGWNKVDVGAELSPAVEPFPGQPVRPYQELRAKTITEPKPDAYVLDLGQNMAGFARLKVKGTKGQKITLRFAERLSPDGTVYVVNLRGARATDTYTCKGEGVETWTPKFTFHGFQYIEVTGLGHKPKKDEIVGIAVSSDTPTVGTFETSDAMINRLVKNAWWTQRMNFIDIPTDCPQRDERLGWTGDAQAYVRTATMLTDVHPFFTKWLVSLDDAQREDGQFPMVAPLKVAGPDGGPAWADAGVICPWTIYDVYGDRDLLARHYPQMRKFVEFCIARSKPDLLPPNEFHCFGDWVNINSPTPNEVIYSAYFAGSTRIVAQAARVLGNSADADKYDQLYEKLRTVFQKAYVSKDGIVRGDSQCGYVLALVFDLVDKESVPVLADRLIADIEKRDWHLSTGFVGTRDIMHVLSKIGRNDVAFRLLHNTTFPSWGFTIANGATSIWERWDGWTPEKGFQDPGMNSFAHYAFGAVVGWMFAQPAGITNPTAGFETIKVAPQIDPNLTWLKSSYNSVRGKIVSEWSTKNGKFSMKVVVPPNCRAEIHVPAKNVRSGQKLDGTGVFQVGSGAYTFTGDLN